MYLRSFIALVNSQKGIQKKTIPDSYIGAIPKDFFCSKFILETLFLLLIEIVILSKLIYLLLIVWYRSDVHSNVICLSLVININSCDKSRYDLHQNQGILCCKLYHQGCEKTSNRIWKTYLQIMYLIRNLYF